MSTNNSSRLRMHKFSKTSRNLSTGISSIDMNIENLLSSPKAKKAQKYTGKNIEDSLLERHAISRMNLSKVRSIHRAQEVSELKETPNIGSSMKNIFKTKSQLEIRAILEKISNKRRAFYEKPEKIDTRRPQDVIEKPDPEYIREVLTRIVPKEATEKVDLKSMKIVEKTDYYLKKRKEREEVDLKKKNDEIIEKCTFKPDLSKPHIFNTERKSSSPNLVKKKSVKKYVKIEKQKNAEKQEKVEKHEKNDVRPPPPFDKKFVSDNQSMDKLVFLSSNYSQFSPLRNEYRFAEGTDLNELRRKSKRMMSYHSFIAKK